MVGQIRVRWDSNLADTWDQLIVLNKVGPRECELLVTQIFGPMGCQAYLI
jgi:hypothetical protein